MPYIGRNHIAGDHTSNFKVLDDISSYTATFDGSSANIVSTADETIRITEHRFIQGQRVTYSNGGGGNIGGLTNGTAYFVTFDTANTFKLATSLANANNNTNINLSSVGTGSSHTLTAAFDGVNTTFKLTHGGGTSADIVNSAQLQIAINNVIQKANQDSTYTEGFRVVDSRKIQFKTAPTVDDVFWGNIIANTIETFDLADLKVDNFTGNGTTTQFTLSRAVPNNESIMVTIDGVLQHPSDKDTTRAYRVLSDSVIEFSSPPPNHGNIQVRHLGFAGASTGDVSGFYGRTGNVVLGASDHITTGDITPRNINASGIVTASSFVGNLTGNVSGNLTVGGVLTYEDVTNVDSIGIITARSDIHVGAGVSAVGVGTFGSLDIGGDIDVDGHTNLDNVSVGGAATITAPNNAMPFKIATSKSSGGIGTYLFTNSVGRFDFNFENTYNGNWYTGSTFHTRILWTAPNEVGTTPEVCSIMPNTAAGGAGGGLHSLEFKVTDNTSGLKRAYQMSHDQHAFWLNDNVQALVINSVTGVGVTSYIYHGYTGGVSDTNTRFGFPSNHNIVFDTDGTERLRINNSSSTFTGDVSIADKIIHTGDTNTAIRFPAADTIRLETGGSTRLTVDSNGNTLISGGLYAQGNSYISDSIIHDGDTNTKIRFPSADTITAETAGSERVRIDSLGNVSIGGINPVPTSTSYYSASLHIHQQSNNSTSGAQVHLTTANKGSTAGDGAQISQYNGNLYINNQDDGNMYFLNNSNSTIRMTITSGGALGFAGANYGSSGQVLTSQGSSSAPTWTTISGTTINNNADNRLITGSGTANTLNAHSSLTFNGTDLVMNTSGGRIFSTRTSGEAALLLGSSNAGGATLYLDGDSNGDWSGGDYAYISHATNGHLQIVCDNPAAQGAIDFFTGNTTYHGTITSDGILSMNGASNSRAIEINPGGNAGTIVLDRNGYITSMIRASDGGSNVAGGSGGGSRIHLAKTQMHFQTFPYTSNIGDAPTYTTRCSIDTSGHFVPGADDNYDLGTSSLRWRDLYTGDLHLSNKTKGANDVDGSWGDWTLQEGESDVFMINNRSGKKFKIKMEEVD